MNGRSLVLGAAVLAFGAGAAEGKPKDKDAGVKTPDAVVGKPSEDPVWTQCSNYRHEIRIAASGVLSEVEAAARAIAAQSGIPTGDGEKVKLGLEKTEVCLGEMDSKPDPQFAKPDDVLGIDYTPETWTEHKHRDLANCMASERVFTEQTAGADVNDCNAQLVAERDLVERLQLVLNALKALVK